MANVDVTYQDMRDGAAKLRTGQQEIEDKLSQLMSFVNSLVSGGYVTDASSKAFQSSYETFDKGAKQTIAGLDGMAKYLEQAAQTFEDSDRQLAQALG